MELKRYYAQDAEGNLVSAASCAVYVAGTQTLATIYNKNDVVIGNPLLSDGTGLIEFKAADGVYDLSVTANGRTYVTSVQCLDSASVVGFTDTVNQKTAEFVSLADQATTDVTVARDVAEQAATDAQAQAAAAADSASSATDSKNAAMGSAAAADSAKVAAEAARDAAQLSAGVYASTAAGLAATTNGQYFSVPSAESSEYLILYKNSAGAAVEVKRYPSAEAIDNLGFENVTEDINEIIFSVTDEGGRRTWLEARPDGGPTDWSANKIGSKLTASNAPDLVGGTIAAAGFSVSDDSINDLSFSITDEHLRRTWLEADKAGNPTDESVNRLSQALNVSGVIAPKTYSTDTDVLKITSGPDIVCWGDSMTAGGVTVNAYPLVLADLLAAKGYQGVVRNSGVGGETSVTITARTGANPFLLLPVGGVIPASGSVVVDLLPINGHEVVPLVSGTGTPGGSFAGTLAGVGGTLTRETVDGANVWSFARTTPGAEVVVNRPTPYRTSYSEARRGDIAVIWIGQNGPSNERAIQDAKAIVGHMTALDKRFIVISPPGGTSAKDVDDAAWFAEFGRRFIAIRQYMVEYGLSDAGITPTEQDLMDMANGTVPSSLRVDQVHWTPEGKAIVARVIFERMIELGWV